MSNWVFSPFVDGKSFSYIVLLVFYQNFNIPIKPLKLYFAVQKVLMIKKSSLDIFAFMDHDPFVGG